MTQSPADAPTAPLTAPPVLVKGDTIAVVAPSYLPRIGQLKRGVKALERAGFKVIVDPDIEYERRYQRQEDAKRAENFTNMWVKPEVKAVLCGSGGYGAVRMIPFLDPAVFQASPRFFCGYSDITALHLWLMRQAGLRVFHGPTADDLIPSAADPTTSSLITAMTTPKPPTRMGRDVTRTVRPGRASGRLTGGNMSMIQQTIGTPYQIDTDGAILFLEETNDPMSVADERIIHLRAAGLLDNVKGIVFGSMSLDRSEDDEFENFIVDLLGDISVPVLMDFPAGHEVPNMTLPFGTNVEITAGELTGWLSYKEDALSGN